MLLVLTSDNRWLIAAGLGVCGRKERRVADSIMSGVLEVTACIRPDDDGGDDDDDDKGGTMERDEGTCCKVFSGEVRRPISSACNRRANISSDSPIFAAILITQKSSPRNASAVLGSFLRAFFSTSPNPPPAAGLSISSRMT